MAGLSYDFVFPKLHGIWAESFSVERISHIAAGQDLNVLSRALTSLGIDIDDRREVQKALFSKLIEQLHQIQHLLDDPLADFYRGQIERFFFENLKTILHYRYHQGDDSTLNRVLITGDALPPLPLQQMLEARTIHQFYQLLPKHVAKEQILPVLVELDDTKDMLVAEGKLDRIFYESLAKTAGDLPRLVRGSAQELVSMEVDVLNIITCLRNIAVYKIPPAKLRPMLLDEGGTLDPPALTRLAAASDEEEVISKIPSFYRKALQNRESARLYVQENALWSLIYRRSQRCFRDFNRPALSVTAFPFLKRFEYLNLSRLFEGLYLQLSPKVIRSMIIGTQDV
ncbi:MAG: V-type ATPase subunit [Lentisphaeria bacterium]